MICRGRSGPGCVPKICLKRFDEVRRREQLDATVAEMLQRKLCLKRILPRPTLGPMVVRRIPFVPPTIQVRDFQLPVSMRPCFTLGSICGFIPRWVLAAMLLFIFAASLTAATGSAEQAGLCGGKDALRAGIFIPRPSSSFASCPAISGVRPICLKPCLLQAQAQIEQTNYAGALELLGFHQKDAGTVADQILVLAGGNPVSESRVFAAADSFAALVKQFPASPRRLEAVIREATARATTFRLASSCGLAPGNQRSFSNCSGEPGRQASAAGLSVIK